VKSISLTISLLTSQYSPMLCNVGSLSNVVSRTRNGLLMSFLFGYFGLRFRYQFFGASKLEDILYVTSFKGFHQYAGVVL